MPHAGTSDVLAISVDNEEQTIYYLEGATTADSPATTGAYCKARMENQPYEGVVVRG